MKRLLLVSFSVLSGLIHSENASAYEVKTHEDISEKAIEASVLVSPSSVLDGLQLKDVAEDSQKFPGADGKERTILALIKHGAEQEDNLYIPAIAGSRFMHHFYDPINDRPLTDFTAVDLEVTSLRYGDPYQPIQNSPSWTLEDERDFLDDKYHGQIFSYKDAREYFYKAVTEFPKSEREKSFGLTFQTLGHIIHHIQDMAQPQHVKNEKHPPIGPSGLYEHYTEDEPIRTRLPFGGYAPVDSLDSDQRTFDLPRKFWVTNNGIGKGLAEFTNFNFVTYGHNFTGTLEHFGPDPIYPDPSGIPAIITAIDFPLVPADGFDPTPLEGKMYFIGTPVIDRYRPSESRDNLTSTYSIYDDDLHKWNLRVKCLPGVLESPSPDCTQQAVFSVNRFTMNAAHRFLIPRAVAYSAGLINYFFRGKIDMVQDPQNSDHYIIKNDGTEPLSGAFYLYYDDVEGDRLAVEPNPSKSFEPIPWWTPLNGLLPGETMPLPAFAPPPNGLRPPPKTPGEYILVFKGTIGEEHNAVAAKVVNVKISPFLLQKAGSLYRSRHLDQDWVKLNDERIWMPVVKGYAPTEDLLFLSTSFSSIVLWRSTDGGHSFTPVSFPADLDGHGTGWTYLGGSEMLVSACPLGIGFPCGMAYSADLGVTWEYRPHPFGTHLRVTNIGQGVVIASGENLFDSRSFFLKSPDRGATWTDIDPVLDGEAFSSMGDILHRDWRHFAFAWNQVEGEGSILLTGGVLYREGFNEGLQGLWKSVDGGQTWRYVWGAAGVGVNSVEIDPWGNALMTVSEPVQQREGAELGVLWRLYRSIDAGETWQPANEPSTEIDNYAEGVVYLRNHLAPPVIQP